MGKLSGLFNFSREEKKRETRYILSIDGGGMRGIIPARVMTHLSRILKENGDDRPLYSHFDLIAGTSTGGLIAGAMSCPRENTELEPDEGDEIRVAHMERERGFWKKPFEVTDGWIRRGPDPEALEKLYSEQGGRIFSKPPMALNLFGPIFQDKYDHRNLERFIYEMVDDTPLEDLMVPTAIISYETKSGSPYVFRSYDPRGFLLREALRATSAAPTYFAPAVLEDRTTGENLVFIDGGVGANNPAFMAYLEAKRLYPDADEYRMLSLSTGKAPYSFDPSNSSGGFTGWASSITKVYSTAQENLSERFAESMPDLKVLRIYSDELKRRIPLDDVSPESICMLKDAGERVFLNQEDELRAFAAELEKAPTHADAVRLGKAGTLPLSCSSVSASRGDSSNTPLE